jgi:hypothetical protein
VNLPPRSYAPRAPVLALVHQRPQALICRHSMEKEYTVFGQRCLGSIVEIIKQEQEHQTNQTRHLFNALVFVR